MRETDGRFILAIAPAPMHQGYLNRRKERRIASSTLPSRSDRQRAEQVNKHDVSREYYDVCVSHGAEPRPVVILLLTVTEDFAKRNAVMLPPASRNNEKEKYKEKRHQRISCTFTAIYRCNEFLQT